MKKLSKIILALAAVLALTACSSNKNSSSAENSLVKITVGASPAPHAEILEQCIEPMKEKGYELEIIEFTDYVMPNTALEDGEIDANFFAHEPYQLAFNKENGTHIKTVTRVHFEPMSIYGGLTATLNDISDGAVIAIPNDTTNEGRALFLCQALGLIELPEDAEIEVTPNDIVSNPYNIVFSEVEAAQTPNVLPDVDFAIINGNYAVSAGIADTKLSSEANTSFAAKYYANVLSVKEGNENNPAVLALSEILNSETIKAYIDNSYQGAVVSVNP